MDGLGVYCKVLWSENKKLPKGAIIIAEPDELITEEEE
jgi:hypothetical protein